MEAKKNPLSMQIDPALFEAATDDEKRQADVMSESTTFFKDGMRKLMKNPLAVGSIIVFTIPFASLRHKHGHEKCLCPSLFPLTSRYCI